MCQNVQTPFKKQLLFIQYHMQEAFLSLDSAPTALWAACPEVQGWVKIRDEWGTGMNWTRAHLLALKESWKVNCFLCHVILSVVPNSMLKHPCQNFKSYINSLTMGLVLVLLLAIGHSPWLEEDLGTLPASLLLLILLYLDFAGSFCLIS